MPREEYETLHLGIYLDETGPKNTINVMDENRFFYGRVENEKLCMGKEACLDFGEKLGPKVLIANPSLVVLHPAKDNSRSHVYPCDRAEFLYPITEGLLKFLLPWEIGVKLNTKKYLDLSSE